MSEQQARPTVYIETYGCQMNVSDSELMLGKLAANGYTPVDAEGHLHGDRPGKAWMALNIGLTGGIAKEVDDGAQLIIEAVVSTATDASTAGTGRILATCASTIFLLTRHGRDVVLPKFTQIKIVIDRPDSVSDAAPEH